MRNLTTVALLFALAGFALSARAEYVQQGNKLIGTGATGAAAQGQSVAISADGSTALVGGNEDNGGAGAVWAYTQTAGIWSQQGNKLVGTGAVVTAQQGSSVAISADGNTALIGGQNDNNDMGAAWVFTRSGGVWTQQGSKLVGSGAVGGIVFQGCSVALSGDGNTALIGGYYDNSQMGAVWVFTRSGGVWTQQGNKLVGTGSSGSTPNQGASVVRFRKMARNGVDRRPRRRQSITGTEPHGSLRRAEESGLSKAANSSAPAPPSPPAWNKAPPSRCPAMATRP